MSKVKKTPKQKLKKFFKVLLIIILVIAVLCSACAVVSLVGIKSNKSFISDSLSAVKYSNQLKPEVDDDGYYTFVTDKDFKVMQLTDVHFGAGFLSIKKDNMAINAVAAMITAEKPDLVIVTGDIAYPVPFQSGTFNNKSGAVMFADLMEKLGVYWCLAFGNHDTEAYSYYSREDIAKLYSNHKKYPHCLFQSGPQDVDGSGNYVVKVKNSKGKITQCFFMLDSHSYTDNDYFGALWKYDCVHKNQVEWYKKQVTALTKENGGTIPKSMMFLHMPLQEMQDAYYEYRDNNFKDTANVQYKFGKAGESDIIVYSSTKNYGLFEAAEQCKSTQAIFFGHDHLNNFSLEYNGIRLTYGYTVDYLAYTGIYKYGAQRGCTIITCKPNGEYECKHENYYQDKYKSVAKKETVTMEDYK